MITYASSSGVFFKKNYYYNNKQKTNIFFTKSTPGRQNGAVGMCVITFLELGILEVEKKREMKIAGY